MVSLQSLGLILALYGLGIQAAPSQEVPAVKDHEVSILDLVRNGTVTDSGAGSATYKYSLPEPNRDDHFEVDGITFYKFPEGGVAVPPGFWDERDIAFHNATNSSSLEPRQSYITSCEPCKCVYNQQVWYEWQTQNWNTVRGNTHQISDTLCPPGSISKTYTKSYTYQVSVQAGPDFNKKLGPGVLEKFGLRVGFSYTWGKAVATSYGVSWTTAGQQHPFVETFRPNIFVVDGIARVCSVSDWSHMNIHVPLVNTDNNDCQNSGSSCGAAGTYDSCFFIGKYATQLCPGRNLGPTPVGRECPTYLYPYPFSTNN
ncbi:hypothetical protein CNMCM5623_005652 [Aspergillus felis]|uniref:Uncharacterized protein n=1 Tax=Aspergillus felis TaxID=1287682 RepID=A0A8H6V2Z9_9EURO|nr:hypothetical protein CNMCM5623_005652 [Aspergillus felis]KAF7183966.1 hypothetical protein CNMCM7691_004456 [Aspergillus felis]